jgi:hypothetical protein
MSSHTDVVGHSADTGACDTRVLVCGSRTWTDRLIVGTLLTGFLEEAILNFGNLVIIEGCAKGADMIAHHFFDGPCEAPGGGSHAGHINVFHEHFPADWDRHGKRAGYVRNQRMLDEGRPQVVLAFRSEGESRGTDMMVNLARQAGVRTYVVSDA